MTADLDSKLIAVLQQNGRATYQELAAATGVPRAKVSTHVQALLASGTLTVVAVAHPELLGLKALAHVSISVSGSASPVIAELCRSESTVYVSAISGRHNIVTELRVPDQQDLYEAIGLIRAMPGVTSVRTHVFAEVVKGIFVPKNVLRSDVRLDQTDVDLIELLEHNGRVSFLELSERTGLSRSAVRNRVNHLIAETAIQIGAVVKRRGGSTTIAMGIGVSLGFRRKEATKQIEDLPGIEFLARTLGTFDLIGTVAADSAIALYSLAEHIRSIEGVTGLETWIHLEVVKEHYGRSLELTGHHDIFRSNPKIAVSVDQH
ncbi:Lrp/AsnC family transcriptional regulator [Rhodococcus sp. IEGM 1366]|uniref:Lrp/AsnC family transcriptional regulator n=1 Tax=Rhodococcus sp. IEGM 1366 TaxID=3082223 RepID=UPI0029559F0D|nr:Lrp/AsnC family transcriptional regulator [Rhodococcus sp. IEGM 1366]MDV8070715.1 Lrp/AsnC family transcriptional regulator [Rhodococcus sp. IEGM 1366]